MAVLMNAKMAIVEFERFNFDRGKSEFIYAFTLHFQMELFRGFFREMNIHAVGESAFDVERALSLLRALRC
jgi:hypothetical protein